MKKCLPCLLSNSKCRVCGQTVCISHWVDYKAYPRLTIKTCTNCSAKKKSAVRKILSSAGYREATQRTYENQLFCWNSEHKAWTGSRVSGTSGVLG